MRRFTLANRVFNGRDGRRRREEGWGRMKVKVAVALYLGVVMMALELPQIYGLDVEQIGCFQKVPPQQSDLPLSKDNQSSSEVTQNSQNQQPSSSLPSFLQYDVTGGGNNGTSRSTPTPSILSFLDRSPSTSTSTTTAPAIPSFLNNNSGEGGSQSREDESTVSTAADDLLDLWYSPSSSSGRHLSDNPRDCIATCFMDSFRFAGVSSSLESGLDCLCGSSYGRYGMGRCSNCTREPMLGCGSITAYTVYDTGFKVPSAPQQIILLQRTENALRISWRKPLATNGPLKEYKISATPLFSYSHERVLPQSWEVSASAKLKTYLVGLAPATQYNVTVAAVNGAGTGRQVTAVMWTKIGLPDRPEAPRVLWHNKRQMRITMDRAHNSKGPISAYRLVVIDEHQTPFFNKDRLITWNESMTIGYPYYTVAEFSPEEFPSDFIIGNGGYYGGFYNGPMPSNGHWHPALGIVSSMDGFSESAFSVTSHGQHADTFIRDDTLHDSVSSGGIKERIEVIGEDIPAVVMFLWISIGVSSGILFLCIALYVTLKMQRRPKRRRARSSVNRPLQQYTSPSETSRQLTSTASTDLTFSTSFLQGLADAAALAAVQQNGAYTHAGFVHDEDMKTRCLNRLKPVQYLPRTSLDLPGGIANAAEQQQQPPEESALRLVAKGAFGGPVYISQMRNTQTLITLISVVSDSNANDNLEEMELLIKWLDELVRIEPHENVVRLQGFTDTGGEIFLAVDGALNRVPLKHVLLQTRGNNKGEGRQHVSSYQLLLCAMNVAEAMFHLNSYKNTHGQLTTTNVLITGDISVPKLTGFGVLKNNPLDGEKDYTRWKSVEQFQNRCTPPCDVWAFGVLFWEIAALGATPYHDVRTEDLQRHIVRGGRPTQIEMMGDVLYQILSHCWQLNRDERPDFSQISCSIHELLPHSEGNLFVSQSFTYPPYVHHYEYTPSE